MLAIRHEQILTFVCLPECYNKNLRIHRGVTLSTLTGHRRVGPCSPSSDQLIVIIISYSHQTLTGSQTFRFVFYGTYQKRSCCSHRCRSKDRRPSARSTASPRTSTWSRASSGSRSNPVEVLRMGVVSCSSLLLLASHLAGSYEKYT